MRASCSVPCGTHKQQAPQHGPAAVAAGALEAALTSKASQATANAAGPAALTLLGCSALMCRCAAVPLPLPPQPSFASFPTDKLPATLKTLAVPDTGNLVVAGALPTIAGQAAVGAAGGEQGAVKGGGHPEAARTWLNRMYLRVSACRRPTQQQCVSSTPKWTAHQ